jgi:hypothetical protein
VGRGKKRTSKKRGGRPAGLPTGLTTGGGKPKIHRSRFRPKGGQPTCPKIVNVYRKGSNTPLAVYRYAHSYGDEEIELDPKNTLKRDTWYTVKVGTGVTDGANNLEAPKTWSFKTK